MTPPLALLLDFDGTLITTAPTPDAAIVSEELRTLIAAALERLEGRLAIISGRSLEQARCAVGPGVVAYDGRGEPRAGTAP